MKTTRPTAKALNKPLLIAGVDMRLAGLALVIATIVGAANDALVYKGIAVALFVAVCTGARIATRRDPNLLVVWNLARRHHWLYEARSFSGCPCPRSRNGVTMLPLPKFIKPWKDAGEANALFAPCAFIDEHVFLTKTGDIGVVFELAGIDSECLTDATMEANTKRLEAAWRFFHEDTRFYQYVVKPDGAGIDQQTEYDNPAVQATVTSRGEFLEQKGLYSIRLYLAILLEPRAVGQKAASSFLNKKALRLLIRELEENREKLLVHAQAFERTIGDLLALQLLPKSDVFQFFRVLANLDKETAAAQTLRHDSHVDFYMTSSAAAPHREGLRVGHQNVEVLSLRETPSETFPNVFRDLLKLECNFILASEFRRLINDDAIAKIRSAQSHHYWNQWISDPMALLNLILSFGKKDDLVADESETDDVDELTQTLKRVKNGGEYLGEFSFTVVLFAEHNRAKLRTTAADVVKIFGAHEGALIQESYNALNAYLSIVPGNGAFNVRRAWLLSGNYADVSLVYAPSAGDSRNRHLSSEASVVLTTEDRTPYYFNVYEADRFGMLIFGAPGAGKSVTTNLLIDHSQKDGPQTFILDIGGSYKALNGEARRQLSQHAFRRRPPDVSHQPVQPRPDARQPAIPCFRLSSR